MRHVRMQVRRIGPHFRSVLVRGETGTGKELVARALHATGGGNGPFVSCPAELAIVMAGFSDSATTVDGLGRLMKAWWPGTLFLDGVNELGFDAQDRLLRVLGQDEFEMLRIVAAATEDLRVLVSAGRFRQELFARLATVEITLPPLRDRVEDLPELTKHFLTRFPEARGRRTRRIDDDAMDRLQEYLWPGNVNELMSVLHEAVLRCDGDLLQMRHLPPFDGASRPQDSPMGSMRLEDVVEQHVLRVLKDCGGNKLRTAETLGISRSTLYRMLDAGASPVGLR
jgi:DNA-binding NtrC family response regulator